MSVKSFIQCRKTGKLIPKEEYYAESKHTHNIITDIEPFVSNATSDTPVISSRSQLREYCKKHGLVPAEECRGMPVRTLNTEYKRDKKGVIEAIKRAMNY